MKRSGKLIVVESPAKIKTISKFLGKEFVILSTFGHIKDLPTKKLGISIKKKNNKKTIDLDYVVLEGKEKKIAEICARAKKCEEIFLASDPDREGEIIAWHIGGEIKDSIEAIEKDKPNIFRITFNEITKPAILNAINNKSNIDMHLVNAQQARRALDRWVGYEVSPILWRKVKRGLSAGRVQSSAMLLICNREEEIVSFKPQEYWTIHAIFATGNDTVLAELSKINGKNADIKTKEQADKILNDLKKESFIVTSITVKKRIKNPLPPFMTSTLQQDAFNKLGFNVDKTMKIAQKLYEGLHLSDKENPEALITYMRTDSLRLSDTALNASRSFIQKNYGEEYLPKSPNLYSKKDAQDAHEAIRPINIDITPSHVERHLQKDEAKLYELIWKRTVASQMSQAEYSMRQVTIEGGKYLFKVTGSTLLFDGFLKVYAIEEDEGEEEKFVKIPKSIEKDVKLKLSKLDPKQHFTQPPARYTEASLVKEMEKQGIGRPSTYAAILATIQKRDYTIKDKKRFMPTELGKSVTKMLAEYFPDIINLSFTAKMEEELDKIAQGQLDRDLVLLDFYDKFIKDLESFSGQSIKRAIETDLNCPKCGNKLVIRFGKSGEFVGCSKYPECDFTSSFIKNSDGSIQLNQQTQPSESNIKCPNCGKNLVQKMGKFGPFLACSGYPECKYIHQETLSFPCPNCKSKIVKRKSSKGTFWGCSNYPKCKFVIFGQVEEKPCPKCKKSKYLLVTKNKEGKTLLSCPDKDCGFSKELDA